MARALAQPKRLASMDGRRAEGLATRRYAASAISSGCGNICQSPRLAPRAEAQGSLPEVPEGTGRRAQSRRDVRHSALGFSPRRPDGMAQFRETALAAKRTPQREGERALSPSERSRAHSPLRPEGPAERPIEGGLCRGSFRPIRVGAVAAQRSEHGSPAVNPVRGRYGRMHAPATPKWPASGRRPRSPIPETVREKEAGKSGTGSR